jgi:very-short-patch-repair endonuclease
MTKPVIDFITVMQAETKMKPVQEYRFHPVRRWRFDYALPELKIAIEVEGGVFTRGRHTRPTGYINDLEKYNHASLMGWTLLRVIPGQLYSTQFMQLIKDAIKAKQS